MSAAVQSMALPGQDMGSWGKVNVQLRTVCAVQQSSKTIRCHKQHQIHNGRAKTCLMLSLIPALTQSVNQFMVRFTVAYDLDWQHSQSVFDGLVVYSVGVEQTL